MAKSLVVIGGTAAGMSAAAKAKRLSPELEVVVYEKTGYISYGTCGLPYFAGDVVKRPEALLSFESVAKLKEERDITAHVHHEVTRINRADKTVDVVDLQHGRKFVQPYDYLVIATGANPVVPDIANIRSAGVYYMRNMEDGLALKEAVRNGARRGIIIGGGLIGLETSETLTGAGLQVVLIEMSPRLLPFMPEKYSEIVLTTLREHEVQVHLGSTVEEILAQNERAVGVRMAGGRTERADFVLVSVGVLPNTALAEECGLKLGLKKGIVVDAGMKTDDASIWACGDCVQMVNRLTKKESYVPLGTTANKQGRDAGSNIAGVPASFRGVLASQATKVFDTYVASTGLSLKEAKKAGFEAASESIFSVDKAPYYPGGGDNEITLVFDRRDGKILGAQAVGSSTVAGRINVIVAAISAGMTLEDLNSLDLVYSPPVAPLYDPLLIAAAQGLKQAGKPTG